MRPSVGKQLSREFRRTDAPSLNDRRMVIGLSLAALGSMGLVTLYQTGIIRRLPEPPLPYLNAVEIDAAPAAYERFGIPMPDAALGLVSYAGTLALAAIGGRSRATTHPFLCFALAGKVGIDAVQALRLTREQWREHRSFCLWCLLAAAASLLSVPSAFREGRRALRGRRTTESFVEERAAL